MAVLSALLYLRLTSLRNFLLSQLRRLRQPRYLLGTGFVVAYFWFLVFRPAGQAIGQAGFFGGPGDSFGPAVGALALTLMIGATWTFFSDQPGLQFSEAEIAFLFPAPLSRRSLVLYKLFQALYAALLQACFFTVIFNRGHVLQPAALERFVGWWLLLSVISLHTLGAALTIARFAAAGWGAGRRRAILLSGGAVILFATCWSIWHDLPGLFEYPTLTAWLAAVLDGGVLRWVLWPAHLLTQPLHLAGQSGWFLSLLAPLFAVTAQVVWVRRLDTAFEEASLAKAAKTSARLAEIRTKGGISFGPTRTKGRRPPFPLARAAWPELAFLWKNLLATRAWLSLRTWLILVVLLLAAWKIAGHLLGHEYWKFGGALAGLGSLCLFFTVVNGPILARLDFRQDLANADLLKTYPLPGWRILLGEMLTPLAILTGIAWLGVLAWFLGLHGHQPPTLSPKWFSPAMRAVWALNLAALIPFLLTLLLLVPNGAAILFPAAFRSQQKPAGLDLMGQRMIFGFGLFAVLLLTLLPGVIIAGLMVFLTHWFLPPALALTCASLAVAVVFSAQGWLVLWWLGERFEKLDISSEMRP